MRAYCEEAFRFGSEYIRADQKCRHITVLLNPVANGRKSKAQFDKYCAPLLHLAGIRVSLVITEAEGQAKDLMEIMDNTDAVLVAGGNGTVHEAVTGLLRRSDTAKALIPLGILPVGKRNTIALELNQLLESNFKTYEVLAEFTMSAIREVMKPFDVMRIEGKKGNPVFALEELNCGKMRDTVTKVDKYWYLGNKLKPYLAFISNSFKSLSSVENTDISYSEPCTGCSKCYERFEAQVVSDSGVISRETTRWWHIFLTRKPTDSNQNKNQSNVDLRTITNEKCNQWSTLSDINAANIIVKNTNDSKLKLIIHSEPITQNQFIGDGVKLFQCKPFTTTGSGVQVIEAMDINIDLPIDSNTSEASASANATDADTGADDGNSDKIESDDKPTNSWFSIDTESYERQSIRIRLMPKMLNMYAL